jgi:hypothetical protein
MIVSQLYHRKDSVVLLKNKVHLLHSYILVYTYIKNVNYSKLQVH